MRETLPGEMVRLRLALHQAAAGLDQAATVLEQVSRGVAVPPGARATFAIAAELARLAADHPMMTLEISATDAATAIRVLGDVRAVLAQAVEEGKRQAE